ncbi:adhesion protein [Salmonella enterica subsp. enterica]|nr:adhesion protein [Salmonella enterica subsp. enterica serovar Hvittingfoss]ECI2948700.1 adhesion protein [Salmonella enterica subsp. enterica serovar Hvittingfoss]EGI6001505.1 adhesion protein [Salmonella enterica subsp. enterica serovar Hvittingfoss]
MTGRLFNMKSLILSGVFFFFAVCDSAQAAIEWSYCNATGSVNIQNINIKSGQYGTGDELQTIKDIPFSYTCITAINTYSEPYNATISLKNVQPMVEALKKSGLGMELFIQEGSRDPVKFSWREIQAGFAGWSSSKIFGQELEQNKTYNLSGKLTVRIYVEQSFKYGFLNINIPASTFDILPYKPSTVPQPAKPYTPLSVSAFNIKMIPDNSGRVIISPSVIKMGRFYTEYKETMASREIPFTVTAQQNVGTQTPFVAPLAIEFRTNDLTLADADSTVILKNNKQENNGFRLSVIDVDNNTPVKFNMKTDMGSIHLDNGAGGKIIKQYKAKVEAIPGAVIKTGAFSAAMTVIVTYN